jgi:MraZ protein
VSEELKQGAPKPYFYGRSEHRINAKGQVAVPARFRSVLAPEVLERGFVLLRGEEPCVYCYTHDQFTEVVDRVMSDPEVRDDADFLRDFFEQVYAVDVDSQGRVVIPGELREEAGLKTSEVVFIGHRDRVEIWDAEARRADREESRKEYAEKRGRLARRIFGP